MTKTHLTPRENFLRAVEFGQPEWIPIEFELLGATIHRHGTDLIDMMARHEAIFPPARIEACRRCMDQPLPQAGRRFTDDWGCEWREEQPGIIGQVVGHPLADWNALRELRVPDPVRQFDWPAIRRRLTAARSAGDVAFGYMGVIEGSFFDRLQFLRGLDRLLMDFLDRPRELEVLIATVLDYNLRLVRLWLDAGVDVLAFHGDIATQRGLMMSPATFREVLKPAYTTMFQQCRQAGVLVKYSCDGNLLDIVDDLIECGVSYHDPQVRANTVEGIARVYRGRLAAMVDIDEQALPFCTPDDVRAQVRDIVSRVATPSGGLLLFASPSSDVPLDNIEAICLAWEEAGAPGTWQHLVE